MWTIVVVALIAMGIVALATSLGMLVAWAVISLKMALREMQATDKQVTT